MFENIKIYLLLSFSNISSQYKKEFKKRILKQFPLKGSLDEKKTLFYLGAYSRSYDIFINSIIALIFRNNISLSLLVRAQLENLIVLNFLSHHPHEIDQIFKKGFFTKAYDFFEKNNPDLFKYYRYLSQRTHPDSEGWKCQFNDMGILEPLSKNIELSKLRSYKDILENFKIHPIITYNLNPYVSLSDAELPIAINNVISFFDAFIFNLDILIRNLPNSKISDYRQIWKRSISELKP